MNNRVQSELFGFDRTRRERMSTSLEFESSAFTDRMENVAAVRRRKSEQIFGERRAMSTPRNSSNASDLLPEDRFEVDYKSGSKKV